MNNPASQNQTAIDVEAVKAALDNQADITLVDVRTPGEYAAGHLSGSVLLPLQEMSGNLEKLPDKTKPIYLYCRRGIRGDQAVEILQSQGYTDVHNLTGGIEAWQSKNYPIQK